VVLVTQSNKWPACCPVTFAPQETEGYPKISLSKYTKRRSQFAVLEAKQLFAADLVGGVAADLPDTPVVAGFDPRDLVAEINTKGFDDLSVTDINIGFSDVANLGGQEGESLQLPPIQSGVNQEERYKADEPEDRLGERIFESLRGDKEVHGEVSDWAVNGDGTNT